MGNVVTISATPQFPLPVLRGRVRVGVLSRRARGSNPKACPPPEYRERETNRRQRYAHPLSTFVFTAVAYWVLMLVLSGAPCAAQDEAPAPATAPSPGTAALVDQASAMESQIAALLRQKNAASTPAPTVDLQLDLKILERWLLLRASDA